MPPSQNLYIAPYDGRFHNNSFAGTVSLTDGPTQEEIDAELADQEKKMLDEVEQLKQDGLTRDEIMSLAEKYPTAVGELADYTIRNSPMSSAAYDDLAKAAEKGLKAEIEKRADEAAEKAAKQAEKEGKSPEEIELAKKLAREQKLEQLGYLETALFNAQRTVDSARTTATIYEGFQKNDYSDDGGGSDFIGDNGDASPS